MESLKQNEIYEYNIINKPDKGECDYCIVQSDGDVIMRYYQVFPGISLVYEDIHAQNCTYHRKVSDSIFEIRHCREGRLEGKTQNEFFYMEAGDLSVCKPQKIINKSYYPLHHYHGITIIIDVEKTPQCLSCFLEDVNVEPKYLMDKFCNMSDTFVARSMSSISHVFDELYSVPENILKGYIKVKVLELMLFLTNIDIKTDEVSQRRFSQNQKNLANNISAYLLQNMDSKITLEQLSDIFLVSATQIKSSIKAVYGISLHNMIRIQKMQSAAKLLENTDLTIVEIAGKHGYDNASKFSAAFKTIIGVTPKEYRNEPIKIENIIT